MAAIRGAVLMAVDSSADRRGPGPGSHAIKSYLPSLDTAVTVYLMADEDDLDPYLEDDGTMDADGHLDVVADWTTADLGREAVDTMASKDVAALFEQIVQDATNRAAVRPDHFDEGQR